MSKPADRRPYRANSAHGDELVMTTAERRTVFRQVGWWGQTGALYSLDEDPSPTEPGSFSPLWAVIDSDSIMDSPE